MTLRVGGVCGAGGGAAIPPVELPRIELRRGFTCWDILGQHGLLGANGLALGAVRRHLLAKPELVSAPSGNVLIVGDPEHTDNALLSAISVWRGALVFVDARGLALRLQRKNIIRFAPGRADGAGTIRCWRSAAGPMPGPTRSCWCARFSKPAIPRSPMRSRFWCWISCSQRRSNTETSPQSAGVWPNPIECWPTSARLGESNNVQRQRRTARSPERCKFGAPIPTPRSTVSLKSTPRSPCSTTAPLRKQQRRINSASPIWSPAMAPIHW